MSHSEHMIGLKISFLLMTNFFSSLCMKSSCKLCMNLEKTFSFFVWPKCVYGGRNSIESCISICIMFCRSYFSCFFFSMN